MPLPVETLGGWGVGAIKHLKRIARALAGRTGRDDAEVQRLFFQRLSVTLMRWNSALLLIRIPEFTTAVIDGVT